MLSRPTSSANFQKQSPLVKPSNKERGKDLTPDLCKALITFVVSVAAPRVAMQSSLLGLCHCTRIGYLCILTSYTIHYHTNSSNYTMLHLKKKTSGLHPQLMAQQITIPVSPEMRQGQCNFSAWNFWLAQAGLTCKDSLVLHIHTWGWVWNNLLELLIFLKSDLLLGGNLIGCNWYNAL